MSRIVALDNWRNFVSYAPDIEITVEQNLQQFINLWPYMLQGAKQRDTNLPDPIIIQEINAQRGWLLQHVAYTKPAHGRLLNIDNAYGFQYLPAPGYIGADCFNYYFTNGTQTSNVARILITVVKSYDLDILIGRQRNTKKFMFAVSNVQVPPGANPTMIIYKWIQHRPTRRFAAGAQRVFIDDVIIAQTVYDPESGVTYSSGTRTDWIEYTWPDPTLTGYDGYTARPYRQPDGPFPFLLQADFCTGRRFNNNGRFVGWDSIKTIKFEVIDKLGKKWWSAGHVIITDNTTPIGNT